MSSARRLKPTEQLSTGARYKLLAHLASGGMGAVYVGRSTDSSETLVAIKRAHEHLLGDGGFREMFLAEARLASRIQHPNVVAVLDVAEDDGEVLMVMEYVEAAPLSDLLGACLDRRRRLPMAVTIRIVLDAAAGLHAAHTVRDERGRVLGMIHRDVSPQNVLVGLDGISRIVDFGVAKAIEHEGTNTQSGVLKGKAAYMAPEYLDNRSASPQSDVFSLGVVAWEALAMRRLFRESDEVATMQRILSPTPAPRLSEAVSIDAAVETAIARALAKEPSARYASARDFAAALEHAAKRADLIASAAEVGAVVDSIQGAELRAAKAIIEDSLEASSTRLTRRRSEVRASAVTLPLRPKNTEPAPSDEDELQKTLKRSPEDTDSLAATLPKQSSPANPRETVRMAPFVPFAAPAPTVPMPPTLGIATPEPSNRAPTLRGEAQAPPTSPKPSSVRSTLLIASVVAAVIFLTFLYVWRR